jgi:hypothetical protein
MTDRKPSNRGMEPTRVYRHEGCSVSNLAPRPPSYVASA